MVELKSFMYSFESNMAQKTIDYAKQIYPYGRKYFSTFKMYL